MTFSAVWATLNASPSSLLAAFFLALNSNNLDRDVWSKTFEISLYFFFYKGVITVLLNQGSIPLIKVECLLPDINSKEQALAYINLNSILLFTIKKKKVY